MKMKRVFSAALAIIIMLSVFSPCAAAQASFGRSKRVIDYSGTLLPEEMRNIDENSNNLLSLYRIDAAAMIVTAADYEDSSMAELGDKEYYDSGFGYGDGKDGFMVIYDAETNQVCVNTYGAVSTLMTAAYIDMLETNALTYLEKYGAWGVLVSPMIRVKNDLEELVKEGRYEAEPQNVSEAASVDDTNSDNSSESFSDGIGLHNADAPRVVDEADLFTPEEESKMLFLIQGIQQKHLKDIVIYTTKHSDGKEKEALASDFYDYNDYGIGAGYEGMCLLFLMEEGKRGFRISAYGDETRRLYTQENSAYMDDCLYNYVKSKGSENGEEIPGDYGLGVINWLEDVDAMFTHGYASTPSWYGGDETATPYFHDSAASRVTCETPLFTEEEIKQLEEKCAEVSEKMGIDIAVHATNSLAWMSKEEYAELLFSDKGYGFGDGYDGMLLVVTNNRSESKYTTCTYISGARPETLTEVNLTRLSDHATVKNSSSYSAFKAAEMWLSDLEHMADTGRVMPATSYWIFVAVVALIASFILSVILVLVEESRQKKPRIKETAANYTLPNTLSVIKSGDFYISTRQNRTYSPEPKSTDRGSSSSSSSGSNNYNSSYTSSSGRTHTTSGRDF